MTDRYHALVVVLEKDTRTDDAEHLINAIKMMRGVADVQGEVADTALYSAQTRVRQELGEKLWAVLYGPKEKP